LEVTKLHDKIYRLRGAFTGTEFQELHDEFNENTPSVLKGEPTDFPSYFHSLKKTGKGLGDNMGLIRFAPKVNLITRKLLKPDFTTKVSRINTNIMNQGQQSDFHIDGFREQNFTQIGNWYDSPPVWTWTFLAFCSPNWSTNWDGQFCCQVADGEYIYVPYIPGECVLFDGWTQHKGCGPNNYAKEPRLTVAWTLTGYNI
jgi:hypothetical protein